MPSCPKCGASLEPGSQFCSACGISVEQPHTATFPPPPQVPRQPGVTRTPAPAPTTAAPIRPPKKSSSTKTLLIVGGVIAGVLLIGCIVAGLLMMVMSGPPGGSSETSTEAQRESRAGSENPSNNLVGTWYREVPQMADLPSLGYSDRITFSEDGTFSREIHYNSGPIRNAPSSGRYQLAGDTIRLNKQASRMNGVPLHADSYSWNVISLSEDELVVRDQEGYTNRYSKSR